MKEQEQSSMAGAAKGDNTNDTATQAQPGIDLDLDKLEALARAATPGPWALDTTKSECEYGSDEDGGRGFMAYVVADAEGRPLMDSLNRDQSEIHEEYGEDDLYAWDELAKRDAQFIAAANPAAILALIAQARAARPKRDRILTDKELADPEYMREYVAELREMVVEARAAQAAATLTATQITAGAAVLGDDGKPIGRNTAIMVADAMGVAAQGAVPVVAAGQQAAPVAANERELFVPEDWDPVYLTWNEKVYAWVDVGLAEYEAAEDEDRRIAYQPKEGQ